MRQAPHQKRQRGGRVPGRRGNSQGGHRTFESSGPNVKIRGNANQLFEKYQALARDASTTGDRIVAENYLQHAEHYFRVLNASNDGQQRGQGPQPRVDSAPVRPPQAQPQVAQAQPQVAQAPEQAPETTPERQPELAKVDGDGAKPTSA